MNKLLFALLLGALAMPASATAPEFNPSVVKVLPRVALKAEPFALSQVRLLDGPFKHAQDLDHQYLLSLDPDRLLHNFRINAGLPSSAKPYGGWESPDSEVRGHFVGHYLSACSKMYASTGDIRLKERVAAVVEGMARCQEALHSGYLSAFPESFIDRVEARQPVWAPWYTLHKILAGLIDAYLDCGSRQALQVATKMAGWIVDRTSKLSDQAMQRMLDTEHGGVNEALANLYAITGDAKLLAVSERFNHQAVLGPLAARRDPLTGLHANTQFPKVIGAARQYELTGDDRLHTIATFFWDVVVHERSYVTGGNSDAEYFTPKERLSTALGPNTTETCNTYNMLKLTRHLFEWRPDAEYADYYERALYNHILASQNPETGMMCYYVPLRSGSHKRFNTPTDSFWCCTGTGVENHAQYGDSIYFHSPTASATGETEGSNDRAPATRGSIPALYVNLFIASELRWPEAGLTLRQETRFPEEGSTRLAFTCDRPLHLTVHLRHPGWAGDGYRVRVNGKASPESALGSYLSITRTWHTGDTVEVTLPMALRAEGFRDNPRRLAFLDGPILLCAAVPSRAGTPAIVGTSKAIARVLQPVSGESLVFNGPPASFRPIGHPEGVAVRFSPFYATYQKTYAVYFDELTPVEWNARETALEADQARRQQIQARTVDSIQPGDPDNEQQHGLAGEKSAHGALGDHPWRDARDGGWFSYVLKVQPGVPQELLCTYYDGDRGRRFDILVDGQPLASVTLDGHNPDDFGDVSYDLPPNRLAGKNQVTVRFQAPPGGMAGGLYGCRIVRK